MLEKKRGQETKIRRRKMPIEEKYRKTTLKHRPKKINKVSILMNKVAKSTK